MNKNEECEIVKDLSSLYIDKMLSKSSEKFIEKHLKECEECEKYYKALNFAFLKEDKKEKNNDKIEVNHLKKVNKKITTLKWVLTGIVILILIVIFYFCIKICYINSINGLNISKMADMQNNSNNYKLVQTTTQINKLTNEKSVIETVHYYKDGKHKAVSSLLVDGKLKEETIIFSEDESYEKTSVFNSLKQIDHQTQNFVEERKGDILKVIISRVMLNNAGINKLNVKAKTENFDNKECYVICDSYNGSYRENYIDKKTGDLLKVVSGYENYYEEELFTLTKDVVTDEDVDSSILESNEYKDYKVNNITYEADEITKELYEKIK